VSTETPFHLPYNWRPRPYQQPLWDYLTGGGRRAVVIAHRRYGKDEIGLQHTACSAFDRVGSYCHMLPFYAQARKALWEAVNPHTGKRRIDEAFPHEIRTYTREQEMSIGLTSGSTWQLAGSDNYDALMGTSYAGIVESEYALGNPSAHSYFSPILAENGGWSLIITTPRGHNHAEAMLKTAKKGKAAGKDYYWEVSAASRTNVFTPEQLQDELVEMQNMHGDQFGKSLWLQEYECSFDAAIPGSVWGDCIDKLQQRGMISKPPFDPAFPVYTAWDLGRTDATAIWFFQIFAAEVRILRYHESSLKDIPFYCDFLRSTAKECGYKYHTHWLPHDARARTLAAGGKSIHQQMIEAQVGRIVIAPRLDHMDGIQAARATFPSCWIDEENCALGVEMLKNYHYEWDEINRVFTRMPVHDFSSHGSSAFRTLALCWKANKDKAPKNSDAPPSPEELLRGSIASQSFGQVKKRHFAKMKSRKEMSL
jgi:phage terminase large subunit